MVPDIDPGVVHAAANAVVDIIDPRIERMEKAILGDAGIGHLGLVARVADLETVTRQQSAARRDIEDRVHETAARTHQRIDEVAVTKADADDLKANTEELRILAKRVDRIIWAVVGAIFASAGGGYAVANLLAGI